MSTVSLDFEKLIDQAKQVVTDPQSYFKSMPQTGGLQGPAIFVLVMGLAAGLILFLLSIFGLGNLGGQGVFSLFAVVVYPLLVLIATFVGALIMWVIWRLMGSSKDYEVAFRCISACTAILPICALLSVFGALGALAQGLWGCYLGYLASLHVHKIKAQTAQIVFGIFALLNVLGALS